MKNIIYALYDNDEILLKEIKRMNLLKIKIKIKNIYSPFPIHGIKKYIKHLKSPFNIKIFYYGLFGFLISSLITWYSMILDWPQNIGGKPSYSFYLNFPSFIPILFEITIFCTAHFMCLTYFFKCNLYPGSFPKNPDVRTTDDKFLMEIRLYNNIINFVNFLKTNGVLEISIKKENFYV
ncbi:DUF3341 domain-containing protein [Candidatus Karelsulcia muelleri]|uniref:DUF3341 domain-containing protein n=1 Tax=Candidatus Karelsulcia muelleri TaxID=336810 RepID=UPI000D7C0EE5|nr:DUF3341 domain-containing protein [Candidatus Karelsulcia muelleri]